MIYLYPIDRILNELGISINTVWNDDESQRFVDYLKNKYGLEFNSVTCSFTIIDEKKFSIFALRHADSICYSPIWPGELIN